MGYPSTIVQQAYEAFGRGDAAGVLKLVIEQVDWEFVGSSNLPYVGRRRNPKEVSDFFAAVARADDYTTSSRRSSSRQKSTSPCSTGRARPRAIPASRFRRRARVHGKGQQGHPLARLLRYRGAIWAVTSALAASREGAASTSTHAIFSGCGLTAVLQGVPDKCRPREAGIKKSPVILTAAGDARRRAWHLSTPAT